MAGKEGAGCSFLLQLWMFTAVRVLCDSALSAGNIWTRAAWHAVMENYTAWCSVLTLSRVLIMAQLLVTER